MRKRNKISRKMDWFEIILYTIVSLYVISMIYVLFYGLLNSIKDPTDFFRGNVFGLPKKEFGWHFENYAQVLDDFKVSDMSGNDVYLMEMFFNALAYAVLMSLFSMATQIVTSYAIAKYNFKLKSVLYGVAVVVMLLPIIGSLAAEVQMADAFGFNDNLIGVCIMKCKYPGLYFLVFYATFKGVSWTYAEAAQIDGASHFKIFIEIMLPLVKSTIFAVFILSFIANWNDYYTPMVFMPNKPTLSYGLFLFQSDTGTNTSPPIQLAASILACLPVLVLFAAFKDKIMGNVTMGGIKG